MRRLRSASLLSAAIISIFRDPPERPGARRRAEYFANAATARVGERANVPGDVVVGVTALARSAAHGPHPYWMPRSRYDIVEVIGTAIELLDQHDGALPVRVLPPEQDVRCFIDEVGRHRRAVDVVTQLEIALPIASGELLGAVNLCWISTRLMARGCDDHRAYPGVAVSPEDLARWNRSVAGFVVPGPANNWTSDASGDTYYFWTHVLIELLCHDRGWPGARVSAVFAQGTAIMRFVRGVIVGQQIVSDHREASHLGRLVARAIVEPSLATR